MKDTMEKVLAHLGTGWWHIFHFVTLSFANGIGAPHTYAGVYMTPRLEYECRLPPNSENKKYFVNNSSTSSCSYLVQYPNETVTEERCTEWNFDNSTFTNTVTSEFGLICQRDYLRATYQSLYMLGILVGSPVNGILSDRYGRTLIFTRTCLLYAILAVISCWLPSITSLLAFRFLLGSLQPAIVKTGFIIAMEICDPKVRSVIGVIFTMPWALMTMVWGGMAYSTRSWRYLLTLGSIPSLMLLPALLFLDESPRWLTVKGRHSQASKILKKAARWNKALLPSESDLMDLREINDLQKNETQAKQSDRKTIARKIGTEIFVLLRTPRIRLASLVMFFNYFVVGLVYFGLSFGGGNFNFDIFSYMVLMGLLDLPSNTVLSPVVSRFGRKLPIAISYFITGIVLLIQPFVPTSNHMLLLSLVLTGKLAINMAFTGNNLYATELFPTEVRTRGVVMSFMLCHIGSAGAPFIIDYLGVMYPWVPSVVFGVASAVAGLATLMLWETGGVALPDTVTQLESLDFLPLKKSYKISTDIQGCK